MRTVAEIMRISPLSVTPDTPVHRVHRLLRKRRTKRLLVVDGVRLVGILSAPSLEGADGSTAVSELMETDFNAIGAASTVAEARQQLTHGRVSFLPVMAGTVLVGLLTNRDLEDIGM